MKHIKGLYSALEAWVSDYIAIIMMSAWIVWDIATAVAYLEGAPPQLATVEEFLHVPIWLVWAAAAAILIAGCLIPARRGGLYTDVAVWTRSAGLAVNAALLGIWGYEFVWADAERGWVSGKNYLLITFFALHYGYLVTRYTLRKGGNY